MHGQTHIELVVYCLLGSSTGVWILMINQSHLPTYEEGTDSFPKRRLIKFRRRGNYPEDNILHPQHGKSLKTTTHRTYFCWHNLFPISVSLSISAVFPLASVTCFAVSTQRVRLGNSERSYFQPRADWFTFGRETLSATKRILYDWLLFVIQIAKLGRS
jgi:hypothetical protein